MKRSPFWIVFLSLFMITVFGYTTHTLIKTWQYMRLNEQIVAQNIQWTVISQNDESFIPLAHYSFSVQGKKYEGQTRWQESYLNQWAAEEAIVRLKKNPPLVWISSSSPENSSLQKEFPVKESLYSILLWMLAIYFFGLGYYLNRRYLN